MADAAAYRAAWARRERAEADEGLRRARAAEALLPVLTKLLVERYAATYVALIGSMARGEAGLRSDIDLAAAGIPADRFYEAGAALDRIADPFRVDLVPLETATAELKAHLAAEGRVLHETL